VRELKAQKEGIRKREKGDVLHREVQEEGHR
jgi:hypothetical protein